MATKQIETATIIGTIVNPGNAKIIVTSANMSNSPKTFSVAVLAGDSASVVASDVRTALAFDADVSTSFLVSGTGPNIILTPHIALANDTTLNISSDIDTCTGLTAAPTSVNTLAGDGIQNGYCTLADLKSKPGLALIGTTDDNATMDTFLSSIITAISRKIDNKCWRYFYQTASQTRYFDADDPSYVVIDDLVSLTSLSTDDGTRTYPHVWTATDYDLLPYNTNASGIEPSPYRSIGITPNGQFTFPAGAVYVSYNLPISRITKGVKVTGVWGWPAIPTLVSEACLLWSERTFKLNAVPLGQASTTALGQQKLSIPAAASDIDLMLTSYVNAGLE
jgi:hypothetical protein